MPIQRGHLSVLTLEELKLIDDHYAFENLEPEIKKIYIRSWCYHDINYFAHNITVRWTSDKANGTRFPSPPFHQELWDIARTGQDFLCIVPRNFAKTTAVSKILVTWKLLFAVDVSIMLIMTKGLGEEVVGDIRRELETNELMKLVWGDLVPISNKEEKVNERWRQRQLQLLNGTELKTITKGESVRGNRPTWILLDDPQENKDVRNPVIADEFWNWIYTAVYPSLNIGGSMGVLGTVISNNCFVNKLKQEAAKKNVNVVTFPAIINFNEKDFTGSSLWPERWPMEELKKQYLRLGKEEFMQEYMNEPMILNGSPVFNKEIIDSLRVTDPIRVEEEVKYWVSEKYLENTFVFIGMDMAFGSTHGDYTTIKGRDKNFNLLFEYRGHITQERLAGFLNVIVKKCKDVYILPEQNNALAFFVSAKAYSWYYKIYRRQTVDKVTLKPRDEFGWNTNARTKPIIVEGLIAQAKLGSYQVSREQKEEMQYFYYDETYANALAPYHDDLVIGDALCIQAILRGSHLTTPADKEVEQTPIEKFEDKLMKAQHQNDNDNSILPL